MTETAQPAVVGAGPGGYTAALPGRRPGAGAAGALLVALAAFVALPSANYLVFAGIPFDSLPQYLVLVALAPFAVWPWLRRRWCAAVARWRAPWVGLAIAALAGGALVKGVLFVDGGYEGFAGCYQALYRQHRNYWPRVDDRRTGPCEKSWTNPLGRFHATRIDPVLDFGPEDWNLSFVNDNRFNFYNWRNGSVPRDRLPFSVWWRGVVFSPESRNVALTYVGRVRVWLGGRALSFPTSHGAARTAGFRLPAGSTGMVVEYTFDDGSRVGSPPASGPVLRLTERTAGGGPLRPRAVAAVHRLAGGAVDTLAFASAVLLAVFWIGVVGAHWKPLLATAAAAGAVHAAAGGAPVIGVDVLTTSALLIPAGLTLLLRSRPSALAAAYWCVAALMLAHEAGMATSLDAVLIRRGGSDFLTYESFARSMLNTGSLEGGEEVFYYQPFFRYVLFVERLVLGGGDVLLPAFVRTALVTSVFGLAWSFPVGKGRLRAGLSVSAFMLLLVLVNTVDVVSLLRRGVSEYPTWIAFPLFFALLFRAAGGRTTFAAFLLGLSGITRIDQAPGLLWSFAVRARTALRARTAGFLPAAGVLAILAVLPALHNHVYGGRLVWTTTSATIEDNLQFAPGRWLDVWHDHEAGEGALKHLEGVFYTGSRTSRGQWFAYRGLQALWVVALCVALADRRAGPAANPRAESGARDGWDSLLVLLIPAAFLAPYFFYGTDNYYPRHVVAGHLAMGAAALHAASRAGTAGRRGPAGRRPRSRRGQRFRRRVPGPDVDRDAAEPVEDAPHRRPARREASSWSRTAGPARRGPWRRPARQARPRRGRLWSSPRPPVVA